MRLLSPLRSVHEFVSGFQRLEYAAVCTCRCDGVLLFHTAHLHAHVFGLNDYHDALRLQRVVDAFHYLLGETLLHLQPVREDVDDTCYLAQSGDETVRNVSHMHFSVERQHVVFAHREEVDVLDNDHLVVFLLKESVGKHLSRVLSVATGKYLHGLCHSHGRLL